jgi:hypothetical protein
MVALVLCCIVLPLYAQTGDDDAKVQVTRNFLRVYLLKNESITPFVPGKVENQFAPYPFSGPVQYGTPKVENNQAVLEFKGAVIDANLPPKGGILFYNHFGKWHVRQVLFYNRVPSIFGLPTRSVSASDRKSEPLIRAMGTEFMAAWAKGETHKMLTNWYDWTKIPIDPVKGLSMSHMKITTRTTTWGDPYADYAVNLTYRWGILSYSMTIRGGVILVQENGMWKVRGNEMAFHW